MDTATRNVMIEASRASDEGNQSFGDIVMQLGKAGVERYHQDFLRSERTYYLPDGQSEVVRNDAVETTPAQSFSAPGVAAAVRAVQAGAIKYTQFCRQVMEAGCVGYLVSLAGRRVVYYGRTGDTHVEHFPGAR
ncbi:MAG: DUF1398 family protein [Pseudorhodoplanes sp.]